MNNLLIDLVSDLKNTTDDLTTWDVAESYFKNLQFDVVNCGIKEKDASSLCGFFTNMTDDWMRHYLESRYDLCDPWIKHVVDDEPVSIYLQENKTSFATPDPERCEKLLREVEHEGIRSSVIAPFHSLTSDYILGINLGSALPSAEFLRLVGSNREEILVGLALVQNHLAAVWPSLRGHAQWFSFRSEKTILTPREREVLLWLSQGLRNDRISEKMNVAVVTVNFHMQSIKQKLEAKTREHAVAIALSRNLIEP